MVSGSVAIDPRKTVLVVVDMQNGFLNDNSKHVKPAVLRLVEEFEARQIPVVFTRFHNSPSSQFERLLGWTSLRHRPETEIARELRPHARRVFDKTFYSAFTPTFSRRLRLEGWTNLVLCGVATDSCVLKTAVDAFERGLTPLVAKDACASHAGEAVHEAGLLILARFIGIGQIMDSDSLLSRIGSVFGVNGT